MMNAGISIGGRVVCRGVIGLLAVLLSMGPSRASAVNHPLEPADSSSPRATLESFLGSMHEVFQFAETTGRSADSRDEVAALVNKTMRCLDLSELPPAVQRSVAKESAVLLKEVLDRVELPPESEWPDLSDDPDLTKWRVPHTDVTIVRIKDGVADTWASPWPPS